MRLKFAVHSSLHRAWIDTYKSALLESWIWWRISVWYIHQNLPEVVIYSLNTCVVMRNWNFYLSLGYLNRLYTANLQCVSNQKFHFVCSEQNISTLINIWFSKYVIGEFQLVCVGIIYQAQKPKQQVWMQICIFMKHRVFVLLHNSNWLFAYENIVGSTSVRGNDSYWIQIWGQGEKQM